MFLNIFIGLIMVAITVAIQAYGTTYWLKRLTDKLYKLPYDQFNKHTARILIMTSLFLLLLNFSQALLWALMYFYVPNITEFESLEKAIYFSLVTFTTLGYGDLTIQTNFRILSGIEAINGMLLIGWSTTLMYSAMQAIWKKNWKNEQTKGSN
jgi:hypothetical protein